MEELKKQNEAQAKRIKALEDCLWNVYGKVNSIKDRDEICDYIYEFMETGEKKYYSSLEEAFEAFVIDYKNGFNNHIFFAGGSALPYVVKGMDKIELRTEFEKAVNDICKERGISPMFDPPTVLSDVTFKGRRTTVFSRVTDPYYLFFKNVKL